MRISRRKFLETTACGAASLAWSGREASASDAADCLLLDLPGNCSLPESFRGYETALTEAAVRFIKGGAEIMSRCSTLIVPAASRLNVDLVCKLSALMESGSCILLESGLGFAEQDVFEAQRRILRTYLGLSVERPVHLWVDTENHYDSPYVDYIWPFRMKVRDFSPVVPVSPREGNVIGWAHGLPVALKRRLGKGKIIFLGSPLGPALLAGDIEARRWVCQLIAEA
jgi:hypothetical protein